MNVINVEKPLGVVVAFGGQTAIKLTQVPFSKTECGVDFNINTDTHERLRGVLMEYPSFKTNFFELFFFRKANRFPTLSVGYSYGTTKIRAFACADKRRT